MAQRRRQPSGEAHEPAQTPLGHDPGRYPDTADVNTRHTRELDEGMHAHDAVSPERASPLASRDVATNRRAPYARLTATGPAALAMEPRSPPRRAVAAGRSPPGRGHSLRRQSLHDQGRQAAGPERSPYTRTRPSLRVDRYAPACLHATHPLGRLQADHSRLPAHPVVLAHSNACIPASERAWARLGYRRQREAARRRSAQTLPPRAPGPRRSPRGTRCPPRRRRKRRAHQDAREMPR